MTDSASSLLAILLGLGVFAIIIAVGWRSVQNRRILRFQDASGKETIIVAREDDDVSSVTTTATPWSEHQRVLHPGSRWTQTAQIRPAA